MEACVKNPLTEDDFDFVPLNANETICTIENCVMICNSCKKEKLLSNSEPTSNDVIITKEILPIENMRKKKIQSEKYAPFKNANNFYKWYFSKKQRCYCCNESEDEMKAQVKNPDTDCHFTIMPLYPDAKIYPIKNCVLVCNKCKETQKSMNKRAKLSTYNMVKRLLPIAEEVPGWLQRHKKGNSVDFQEVLLSRTLYYPGSSLDGQPMCTFNTARTCHVFIYNSHLTPFDKSHIETIKGYHLIDTVAPFTDGIKKESNVEYDLPRGLRAWDDGNPVIYILERDDEYDDTFGGKRIALVSTRGSGTILYKSFYCNGKHVKPPFVLVLEDVGIRFGDKFGGGGPMEQLADQADIYPTFFLVSSSTFPWKNTHRLKDTGSVVGGMHSNSRRLYTRI